MTINLFYQEPDEDRWLPLDRYPRRFVRRMLRGPRRPGGQERVFLNLCAGLDRIGASYRTNDFRYARRHPDELCCVLGKRPLLEGFALSNPLIVGPCTHDHPIDDPDLPERRSVRRILVPGEWMRRMCQPIWGDLVHAWPVGIDTDHWSPTPTSKRTLDFLLYNKVRWHGAERETNLLGPVRHELQQRGLSFKEIRYGAYAPEDYRQLLGAVRAMIFICEHETQGIAYQEALSAGVPVLAWDHGGEWLDPSYHPHRVRYGPVSSVPYWSSACGEKFPDAPAFSAALDRFTVRATAGTLDPRSYILSRLTLEHCAREFVAHVAACS